MRLATHGDISVRMMVLESTIQAEISPIGASMTLVGLLPPLCDNGSLLVDGGYCEFILSLLSLWKLTSILLVDNLPVRF